MAEVMNLYLKHADTLRSPTTAKFHAARSGRWLDGFRASQAREAVAAMVRDMAGVYEPSTINRTIGTIKKALTLAWDIGLTRENHGLRIKRVPDPATRDITVTLEQAKAIADKASQQVRAAIWIALYTGMRRGEILALRAQDIGEDAITVRAGSTKTLRTRTVPIVAQLKPWLACVPLALNFEGLKTGFRRAREAAGLSHVTFHDLRRSCGTMMVQAGVDLYVVSKVLGHSSPAVTAKHYAHLQIDRLADGLKRTFG
jgi:integrase